MISLTRNSEDYLETIYNLIQNNGYAQTKDIAESLKVTPPSVSGMLKKLKKQGLINYKKYSPVTLTSTGKEIAEKVLNGHRILKKLLTYLNIPEDLAERDACTMEHELHIETVIQLKNFVDFIGSYTETPDWLHCFKNFCEKRNNLQK